MANDPQLRPKVSASRAYFVHRTKPCVIDDCPGVPERVLYLETLTGRLEIRLCAEHTGGVLAELSGCPLQGCPLQGQPGCDCPFENGVHKFGCSSRGRMVLPVTGAPKPCWKCGGAGWVWGHELNNPSVDTIADTQTRYSCDSCRLWEASISTSDDASEEP